MKTRLLAGICMAVMAAGNLFAVEADVDGATPGKWTMDLDAAKKVAAEKKLPILLDFSGSDWCGWCILMESNVFMKAEWTAYATNNLMMVLVDFPNDKSLVPEKHVERNQALNEKYGIQGFPTFVILDDDGTTELGRLGAGMGKTPASFEAELRALFRSRPVEMARFVESLDPEKQAAFRALTDQLAKAKQELQKEQQAIDEAGKKVEQLQASIDELGEQMVVFRIALLGEDKRNEYNELKTKLTAATKKLEDWIGTNPDNTEENMNLYKEMASEIQKLEQALSRY